MKNEPLLITSFPRAILHIDADAFFTSVEQAIDPSLRGKPVVTGEERGVIACASYEAKSRGIRRGIPLFKARALCPELIILPDDYETYGLYSRRMFNMMRKFTPVVEEYSVDEAFLDITGMRRVFRTSYDEIALQIQEAIHKELGITVSVGLSLSKCLAKLCSKFRKPTGFTAVPGQYVHILLQKTPLEKLWGFGPNTIELLHKRGLETAYDYVMQPEGWASQLLKKPGREIWNELRGNSVMPVTPEQKTGYATILKSKTFTPPTDNRAFVYAKLIRNTEAAFAKARRHQLRPRTLGVVLRRHNFLHDGLEARLNRPTASTLEVLPLIERLFDRIFVTGTLYRSSMVVLGFLESDRSEQFELFEDRLKIEGLRRITQAVDSLNKLFGRHTVGCGTSLYLRGKPENSRDAVPNRHRNVLKGENLKQRVEIPKWEIAV